MLNEQQKKILIEIAAGVGVLVVILIIASYGGKLTKSAPRAGTSPTAETEAVKVLGQDEFRPENAKALETVQGGTREVATRVIATPSTDTKDVPADVAVPTSITPQKFSSYRKYEMVGSGGKFSPSTFVIDERDNVEIAFTATDADYNFSITDMGLNQTIKKGSTDIVMFQGNDFGQFIIMCKASVCKDQNVGTLIVNKKQ